MACSNPIVQLSRRMQHCGHAAHWPRLTWFTMLYYVVLLRAGQSSTGPTKRTVTVYNITLASAGSVSLCLLHNDQTLKGMLGQLHQHHTFLARDRLATQAASVGTTSTQPLSAWRCGRELAQHHDTVNEIHCHSSLHIGAQVRACGACPRHAERTRPYFIAPNAWARCAA
jgi:hypothetical protein